MSLLFLIMSQVVCSPCGELWSAFSDTFFNGSFRFSTLCFIFNLCVFFLRKNLCSDLFAFKSIWRCFWHRDQKLHSTPGSCQPTPKVKRNPPNPLYLALGGTCKDHFCRPTSCCPFCPTSLLCRLLLPMGFVSWEILSRRTLPDAHFWQTISQTPQDNRMG